MKKQRRIAKLNRIEKAILRLAAEIESCPFYDYKLREQILEILGYQELLEPPKSNDVTVC